MTHQTSIRLKVATRKFLEAQAEALGASLQAVIHMILNGVAVDAPPARDTTVAARFHELMAAHRLSLPDAVDVMADFGFTLSALCDPLRLARLLSNSALTYLTELFDVRLEWLAAGAERAIPARVWTTEQLRQQLADDQAKGRQPSVTLVRCSSGRGVGYAEWVDLVAAVRRAHETPSGTKFVTIQAWRFDRWHIAGGADPVASLAALCEDMHVALEGIELASCVLHELALGERLPVEVLGCLIPTRWKPVEALYGHDGPLGI